MYCPCTGISFGVERNGVVAPIIEVKVLDQVREESHLDVAEVDKKSHWTLRLLIDYMELPKKQGNDGDEVDVCISHIDSKKYAYLAECKELTKGGTFPEIPVFVIE
jgi:inorganic pyrophosphatase